VQAVGTGPMPTELTILRLFLGWEIFVTAVTIRPMNLSSIRSCELEYLISHIELHLLFSYVNLIRLILYLTEHGHCGRLLVFLIVLLLLFFETGA
jgi:hypothetical protein